VVVPDKRRGSIMKKIATNAITKPFFDLETQDFAWKFKLTI